MYRSSPKVSSLDRFIPRRYHSDIPKPSYCLSEEPSPSPKRPFNGNSQYLNPAYLKWKHDIYKDRLRSILAPKSERVLNIIEAPRKKSCSVDSVIKRQDWPVHPRKHPLIGSPFTVLDMPDLTESLNDNVIDWGSNGYLATIYNEDIYLWHPDHKNFPNPSTNASHTIGNFLRWNRSSTHIAMTLKHKGIALRDSIRNQKCQETVCPCPKSCTVTSLTWSSTDLLISGCTLGRLCVWNLQLQLLKSVYFAHKGLILTISLSCQEKYLGTTSIDRTIRVWIWPNIKPCFEIIHYTPIKSVAFHPWKDTLLAFGGYSSYGSLFLWNVCSNTEVGVKNPLNDQTSVDALAWNPSTGELVVSYWEPELNCSTNTQNSIVVLSDLHNEVDVIGWHTGRVPYLLWGSDDTKLATAGTDENLCIWNFLGDSQETIKIYKNNKKKAPLNNFQMLSLFGQTIR